MSPPYDPMSDLPQISPERPAPITAVHLAKLALVYIRQSSAEQVRTNTGSTESQRALTALPLRWGWPESRIRVIDDDLGLSGTTLEPRSGFRQMLDLIERGQVGLVVVRDVARLSRDPMAAEIFLNRCIRARVLICADGRVFDGAAGNLAELFGLRMQQVLAWWEISQRARMMAQAKAAKVGQGLAVAGPPVGYVRIARGKWAKDSAPEVRNAVQMVWDLALEGHSVGKILRVLRERQLRLPRRVKGGIVWETPARSTIDNILRNPNYTPDYYFRRRRELPAATARGSRAELRPPSEWLTFQDHHEGYVSRAQWQMVQDALASRHPRVRPPMGKGAALLQGLVWCAACGRRMWTSYHRRRGSLRLPSYLCRGAGERQVISHHQVGAAEIIDDAVVAHVLAALGAVDEATAVAVIEAARAEKLAIREAHRRQLQRAEAEVATARTNYLGVGSEHRLVKADLEAVLEQAIHRRDQIKSAVESASGRDDDVLAAEDGVRLSELTTRLRDLWEAPTTTNEDRKRLLRLALDRVSVLVATRDELQIDLVWSGGLHEQLTVNPRARLDARVRELRQDGHAPPVIVRALQATTVPSKTGRPASPDIVRASLGRSGLNRAALRRPVLLRIRELLLEGRPRAEILRILDRDFPRPRGPWRHDHVYKAIQTIQHGTRGTQGISPLPAEVVERPDMTAVIEMIQSKRQAGVTWRQIAEDLNAAGFRPPRAARFSLFQVMELARRRARREDAYP